MIVSAFRKMIDPLIVFSACSFVVGGVDLKQIRFDLIDPGFLLILILKRENDLSL